MNPGTFSRGIGCAVVLIFTATGTLYGQDKQSKAQNESEAGPAFKVIEVQQTGGFAGVNISYRITPDGKFTRKSGRGGAEGKLNAEETKALSKAVAAIDWEKMPAKLRAPNVADDFVYDMYFIIGKKTHRVTADGISAGKNAQLKPILMTLTRIQRVPIKK
jgi:hypothetical protein